MVFFNVLAQLTSWKSYVVANIIFPMLLIIIWLLVKVTMIPKAAQVLDRVPDGSDSGTCVLKHNIAFVSD